MTPVESASDVYQRVTQAMAERLPKSLRLRRNLPAGGRIRMDRQLPYLCVYRQPADRNDAGARELITTEAAFLAACNSQQDLPQILELCAQASRMMREHFGVFLFLEIWTQPAWPRTQFPFRPRFSIVTSSRDPLPDTVNQLKAGLEQIALGRLAAEVEVCEEDEVSPPGMPPLLTNLPDRQPGVSLLGLAVAPFFRNERDGQTYPVLLQQLRRPLAHAMRDAVTKFTATAAPGGKSVTVYGPSAMLKSARDVDQQLAEISSSFDFLLQVTPVNSEAAWEWFVEHGEREVPELVYRPLPYDPGLLKRRLYQMPVEDLEDPTLTQLFCEKQAELDRQLSALRDLNSPAFLHHSLQIHGGVGQDLLQLARTILDSISPTAAADPPPSELAAAQEVADAAREEINFYHSQAPSFSAVVEVVGDIAAGLMVSRDRLLISEHLEQRRSRLHAILQHEVGTHLLTYFNGRQQPLRLLASGLAGYEGLQEGLAILAEALSGGLTPGRLRTLASRVMAASSVQQGADFLETFRLLRHDFGIPSGTAFTTTLRVHRGGGLLKDAVYLRGFHELLEWIRQGRGIEPLYVGKIGLDHVPLIQELRRREIVLAPSLLPRMFSDPELKTRLDALASRSIIELLEYDP